MQDDLLIITGRLGGAPEMRYMPDGTAVTNFSVAVNRYGGKNDDGSYNTYAIWYRVAVWGRQAEAANQYLQRGQMVTVYGSLAPDKETGGPRTFDRNDGTIGTSYEVNADKVIFGAKGTERTDTPQQDRNEPELAETEDVDDIPF